MHIKKLLPTENKTCYKSVIYLIFISVNTILLSL